MVTRGSIAWTRCPLHHCHLLYLISEGSARAVDTFFLFSADAVEKFVAKKPDFHTSQLKKHGTLKQTSTGMVNK